MGDGPLLFDNVIVHKRINNRSHRLITHTPHKQSVPAE